MPPRILIFYRMTVKLMNMDYWASVSIHVENDR